MHISRLAERIIFDLRLQRPARFWRSPRQLESIGDSSPPGIDSDIEVIADKPLISHFVFFVLPCCWVAFVFELVITSAVLFDASSHAVGHLQQPILDLSREFP